MTKITLQKGTKMFRYDLATSLPITWDSNHKSIEYTYPNVKFNVKNKIGAFFFYENLVTACETATIAFQKCQGMCNLPNWDGKTVIITQAEVKENVDLLDLHSCKSPYQILSILMQNNIDVLTEQFEFNGLNKNFSILRQPFLKSEEVFNQSLNNIFQKINNSIEERNRYFSQLLTDFDNGTHFKALLKDQGLDGYCFTESPTGCTFCIFESVKFLNPYIICKNER